MQMHADETGKQNSLQYLFEGIHYIFTDSEGPSVNRVNNNRCIGHSLLLDPRKPADDPTQDFWVLKHMPLAVYV